MYNQYYSLRGTKERPREIPFLLLGKNLERPGDRNKEQPDHQEFKKFAY